MEPCIIFDGRTNAKGYGLLTAPVNGSLLAHRAVLAEKLGRPVRGDSRHTCDNPPCVNPDHLIEGSRMDNIRDAMERGRTAGRFSRVTTCVWGHPLEGDNLILKSNPKVKSGVERVCAQCRTRRNQEQSARRKAARHERKSA